MTCRLLETFILIENFNAVVIEFSRSIKISLSTLSFKSSDLLKS